MIWDVPLIELDVRDEDVEAVLDCLRSGWLTMGPRTQAFEEALADLIGVKHAIAVSSGTAALHLACRAAGLGPEQEAIVPAMTFVASAHAPRYCGAETILCDSRSSADPNLDPAAVERLIGPRTRAVIAVHMWGHPAAVEELRALCDEHGLVLIEDCAEAIAARVPNGAQVGSIGDLGCFSLFSKGQLAVGEGGIVTTDDDALAASVRSLRSHAMTSVTWERHRGHGLGYDVTDIGFNYRIDEPRAALGLSRLPRLEADVEARRRLARFYRKRLARVENLSLPFDDERVDLASHFAFPVLVDKPVKRDRVMDGLSDIGVQTTTYPPVHRLSQYASCASDAEVPVAADVVDRHFCLPIYSSLDFGRAESVVERLIETLRIEG